MSDGQGAAPSAAPIVRIGLLWHSPNSGNLGIGALTFGNIALLREAAARAGLRPEFVILGFVDPGAPFYVNDPDVEIVALSGRAMAPGGVFYQVLGRLDAVFDIGGGDSFADIYGWKRFAYLWATKWFAMRRGIPLVFSPQTIGPFTRQPYRALARGVMNRAEIVVARDPKSFAVAGEISPRARLLQSVDVAFALPFERRTKDDPAVVEVGINVSGLLFNGGYTGRNEFGMEIDYPAYTRRLIEALLARPGVKLWLVSHVNSDVIASDDDRRAAARLHADYPATCVAPPFASPVAAKSFIAGLDLLVAGRMHACIAAYSTGVPVVPVAYSRKFSGLFQQSLGYSHVVPVHGMSTQAALDFTLDRLDRLVEMRADIEDGLSRVGGMLAAYVDWTAAFLARIRSAGN